MDELSLWLVTDRGQTRDRDLVDVVRDCLAAGLPAVQVREKDLGAADLARLCRRVRELTREAGALLSVNDRVDVALAVGADAVQRTCTSLAVEEIRAIAGKALRIGASVHSLAEAREAERAGADWVVFGPIYDTPSKRAWGPPQGLAALERVAAAIRIPLIAIGGITPERVSETRAAGARGVAAIAAILSADRPADATRRFLEALESAA
ncbi:MAG: thiamine phosphate synthase [Candidatus Rokubacteria bacterium]|nr:thiamine phosphate synthase [Candidatus Rokubacteria bacterium]